jgi:hypothetical protein
MSLKGPDRQFQLLIHEVGHRDRNVKGLAYAWGVPEPTLFEWLNPNNEKKFPAGYLPALIADMDDDRLIHYLCDLRGLVAVSRPTHEGMCDRDWLRHISAVTREASEAVTTLADAVADGVVTPEERAACLKEVDEAVAALMALRVELEEE